jgi:hypothetical protein
VIEREIEDPLSEDLLRGNITPHSRVAIKVTEDKEHLRFESEPIEVPEEDSPKEEEKAEAEK